MKVVVKPWLRVYSYVLSVTVYLTIWAGARTVMGWEENLPAIISILIVAVWASPRIAAWALRPIQHKYVEVVDD